MKKRGKDGVCWEERVVEGRGERQKGRQGTGTDEWEKKGRLKGG